jgi:predicted Zn-dependent protease
MNANANANGPYTDRAAFESLAHTLLQPDAAVDRTSLHLRAEASDFLRFNQARLRQATSVHQAYVTLAVERGLRRTQSTLSLGGDAALDAARLRAERRLLIGQLDLISDDPWLRPPTAASHSTREDQGLLPDAGTVIARVHELAGLQLKQDLVGFYAGGPVVHAFADSLGSRHWHRVESFHFEWCHYHRADKAVKTAYAGTHWQDAVFAARVEEAARQVPLLARPAHTLAPGGYRAAFAPAAMVDLLGTLNWSGFSLKARRTGVSSLMRLVNGEAAFHAQVNLDEAVSEGTAPAFTATGHTRPGRIALVEAGRLPADGGTLNSPRSAAEYGVQSHGVDAGESAEALRLAAGTLPHADLLKVLDTGLYVSNLHYLNYSDRQACRMTGMTRYACFWVEGGELVAPVDVMRFDDDALRLFGTGLVGLSDTPEFTPENGTYGARQLSSITTPAAVVEGFRLTL